MLFKDKYERAKKWQLEQKEKEEAKHPANYDISPEDIIEKGDMLAMMLSGVLTILPIVTILLLIIVLVAMAFMRIL